MSIITFGKGDTLVVGVPNPVISPLGGDFIYTHPSFDMFYSDYGFAYPLDYEAIPLQLILGDKLPLITPHVSRLESVLTYLLIDRNANLWKIQVSLHNDKKPTVAQNYVHRSLDSWWVECNSSAVDAEEKRVIAGFLATDPSQTTIEEFWARRFFGSVRQFLSIKDIVEKLDIDYPNLRYQTRSGAEKYSAASMPFRLMNGMYVTLSDALLSDETKDEIRVQIKQDLKQAYRNEDDAIPDAIISVCTRIQSLITKLSQEAEAKEPPLIALET